MNDYETMKVGVTFHYENVPDILKGLVKSVFMATREVAARIFNARIGSINDEWDKTGKPASFGKYIEDVNPEYVEFIRERCQPAFDEALGPDPIVRIIFDEYGDLCGTLPRFEGSKIWITLQPI